MADEPRETPLAAFYRAKRDIEGGTVSLRAGVRRFIRARRRLDWEVAMAKRGGAWASVLRACERALGGAYAGRERVPREKTGHIWIVYARDASGRRVAAIEVSAIVPYQERDFLWPVLSRVLRPDLLAPGGAELLRRTDGGGDVLTALVGDLAALGVRSGSGR